MLSFDPTQRPTMRALLLSPLFEPLRAASSAPTKGAFAAFARAGGDKAPLPDV